MNRWSRAPVRVRFRERSHRRRWHSRAAAKLRDSERHKTEAIATVDASQKQVQEIVDSLFSFSELAFQEFETQRYLTQLLESNGFSGRDRRLRHAVLVVGDVGQRRARDRARLGHRRHSEGVADAGRRLSRAADRRRAGPR